MAEPSQIPLPINDTTMAAILVGGKSSRFGRNKALAKIGDQSLLECVMTVANKVTREVVLVGGRGSDYTWTQLTHVPDLVPGLGPLSGLHALGQAFPRHSILLLACDMPFLDAVILETLLLHSKKPIDCVVPKIAGVVQPLCAVYHQAVQKHVQTLLHEQGSMQQLLQKCQTLYLHTQDFLCTPPLEKYFSNVNREEDLHLRFDRDGS